MLSVEIKAAREPVTDLKSLVFPLPLFHAPRLGENHPQTYLETDSLSSRYLPALRTSPGTRMMVASQKMGICVHFSQGQSSRQYILPRLEVQSKLLLVRQCGDFLGQVIEMLVI